MTCIPEKEAQVGAAYSKHLEVFWIPLMSVEVCRIGVGNGGAGNAQIALVHLITCGRHYYLYVLVLDPTSTDAVLGKSCVNCGPLSDTPSTTDDMQLGGG